MLNYDHYRQNNNEEYDYKTNSDIDHLGICGLKPKEAILLKCIHCAKTYRNAYKCTDNSCPLYLLRKKWMKRPHTCSDEFKQNRKNVNNKNILPMKNV